MRKNEEMRRLDVAGGGVIRVRSGRDPDGLRRGGAGPWPCSTRRRTCTRTCGGRRIRPALADRRGEALFLSTPRGRNWFWGVWMNGQSAAHPDWKSWRFPTAANPLIDPAEIEAARALLPERVFREEYLAEFQDDGGLVFRRVEACATVPPGGSPQAGARYVFGVDWAREDDFTCIAALDVATRRLVALDRFNEIGWSLQRGRLRRCWRCGSRRRSGPRRTASAGRTSRRCKPRGCR